LRFLGTGVTSGFSLAAGVTGATATVFFALAKSLSFAAHANTNPINSHHDASGKFRALESGSPFLTPSKVFRTRFDVVLTDHILRTRTSFAAAAPMSEVKDISNATLEVTVRAGEHFVFGV
jgi:hypothetical protein